jgi:hypothetical protein
MRTNIHALRGIHTHDASFQTAKAHAPDSAAIHIGHEA